MVPSSDESNPSAIKGEDLQALQEVALRAAQAGAREILAFRKSFSVSFKGRNDLVTDADVAAQRAIEQVIREHYPAHWFVGEESGAKDFAEKARYSEDLAWIVDPIDGTANFVHGLPGFAVSIAVARRNVSLVGVVLDPVSQETYLAVRGQGATLNGEPIRVSGCPALGQAMLACSFPNTVKRDSIDIRRFAAVLEQCQSMRRLGSAALNLCYLAAGRLDGYWATCVNAWDIAAGFLIATEAGAGVRAFEGGPADMWEPKFIAAASQELLEQLAVALHESNT